MALQAFERRNFDALNAKWTAAEDGAGTPSRQSSADRDEEILKAPEMASPKTVGS